MINILVVDDEPISADGISIYLQEHGEDMWVVRTAYNGLQALEIARQRIDILVSDIMMPGLDGFQVQEKIQEMWPMSRCIFLTSAQQIDYCLLYTSFLNIFQVMSRLRFSRSRPVDCWQ